MKEQASQQHRVDRVTRITIGIIAGIISLLLIFTAFYQNSFSVETKVRDCGFFASCQPGNAKEKVRITNFNPTNEASVETIIVIFLIYSGLLVILSKHGAKWSFADMGVIFIVWSVILTFGLMSLVSSGNQEASKTEFIGALTNEEYACQLKVIRSLDTLSSETIDCPSSPSSDAYFKLDN